MKRVFSKIKRLCGAAGLSFRQPFVVKIGGRFWTVGTDSIWVVGAAFRGPFDPWDGDPAVLKRILGHLTVPMPDPIEVETSAIAAWAYLAPVKKPLQDFQGRPVDDTAAGQAAGTLVDVHRLARLVDGFDRVWLCGVDVSVPALAVSAGDGLFRATLAGLHPDMRPEMEPLVPGMSLNRVLSDGDKAEEDGV